MSNLLDKASIILTPTAYNNGEALCVKPSDGSGDFDFSRNSAATRVNAQGLVENVQILSSNLVQNPSFSEEGVQEITNGDFSNGSTDWTLGTGWSIGEDKAICIGNSGHTTLTQINSFLLGKTYKVTFDIVVDSGNFKIQLLGGGADSGNIISSTQVGYTEFISPTANRSSFGIRSNDGNGIGSITNISVKEVGQDWTLGTGISIGNNEAIFTSVPSGQQLAQLSLGGVVGKTYKISYEIKSRTEGAFSASIGTTLSANQNSSVGVYTEYLTATTTAAFYIRSRGTTSGSVTNISVIEITTDTNLPRINYEGFSYDGSGNVVPDSGCGSWLFEPQSTNLITYSEDFSQWVPGGSTTIESGYLAPDGTNNAYKVSGAGSALTLGASLLTTTTRSIYARTVSGTGQAHLCSFNGNTNNLFTITEQWQRFDVNSAIATGVASFYAVDFRGGTNLSEIILWGANATNDQDYATSYIPSNGSQVTRNQDLCTNGGSLASINSTEGVLYAEISGITNDGAFKVISLSDGSTSNVVRFYKNTTDNQLSIRVTSSGVNYFNQIFTLSNSNETNKVALKYKENDFAFWVNGIEVKTDNNGITPIGLNVLNFSEGNGVSPFYGKTKAVAVWKEALTDQELTELTTI